MKFNIFADILHGEKNELAPTFIGKITDTFDVIKGDETKFGLTDYITLSIPYLLRHLSKKIVILYLAVMYTALKVPTLGLVLIPLLLPLTLASGLSWAVLTGLEFLISAALTLISLPIVALVHLISEASKSDFQTLDTATPQPWARQSVQSNLNAEPINRQSLFNPVDLNSDDHTEECSDLRHTNISL